MPHCLYLWQRELVVRNKDVTCDIKMSFVLSNDTRSRYIHRGFTIDDFFYSGDEDLTYPPAPHPIHPQKQVGSFQSTFTVLRHQVR